MLKGVIIYTNGRYIYLEGGSFDANESKIHPTMNGTLYDLTQILGNEKAKEYFEEPWKLEEIIPQPYVSYKDNPEDIGPLRGFGETFDEFTEDGQVIRRVGVRTLDRDILDKLFKEIKGEEDV